MTGVLLALALAVQSFAATTARPEAPPGGMVVVFPFENTSEDRSLYWATEAIADGLTREIRQGGGSIAERSERLSVTEDLGVPPLSTLTLASQIRVAEELGATTLITGSFTSANGQLMVQARVVEVPIGRIAPRIAVAGVSNEIYALQRALYAKIRSSLVAIPASAASNGAFAGAPEDGAPQSAYEFFLKSLFEDSLKKKEFLLRRALDLSPDYLRAQLELAQVYRDSGQIDKAAGALARTVTRDRLLAADAQNLLAEIEIERGHPQAAESALRSSLASIETARAHRLFARIAITRQDRALARSELDRARALDPDDPELAEAEEALSSDQKSLDNR